MQKKKIQFGRSAVDYYFDGSFAQLKKLADPGKTIVLTDENIFNAHGKKFKNWNSIVLKPGEEFKIQSTVDSIIDQLLEFEADRNSILVGIGGGVITDL